MKARGSRHVLEKLIARAIFLLGLIPLTAQGQGLPFVLTWHNDNARTGQNRRETILTPANVNSTRFGNKFTYPVDGQIYAQPLYVPGVKIPGQGTRNVVYVATENDSVYAFDADGLSPQTLWQVSFLNSTGVSAVPCSDTGGFYICPKVGITGTPVIDARSGTLYVVAFTKENGSYIQRLHALDITTGAEKFGGPVKIQASVPGTGAGSDGRGLVPFAPLHQLQRAAMLLSNGVVYIAWASFADTDPYHGWVMSYDGTTLAQVAVFNDSPNGERAGIWQAGGGLAADGAGHIFLQTGNGTFDAHAGGVDYGDSFLKLNAPGLTVADYFTPFNQRNLARFDLDVGSGAGLLLPKQSGPVLYEVLSAGKGGIIYVVKRQNMGKFDPATNKIRQAVKGSPDGYESSPAYWNNAVYYSGQNDFLKRYTLTSGLLSRNPVSTAPTSFAGGSTPSISSNDTTNGIVWALEVPDPGPASAVLHAYDATNVFNELYDTNQAGTRDQPGLGTHFSVPTVANGKVYVGTQTQLVIYGLLQ